MYNSICVFFLLINIVVAEPKWIDYQPIRSVTNLGPILSDIESHIEANHHYKDSDPITWVHETTHGINANIRNGIGPKVNAFYCLKNRAVSFEEPRIRMSDVASLIPHSLRGQVYNLYFVQQLAGWNDRPLYIMDEWIAYTNGAEMAATLGVTNRYSHMIEFDVYVIALAYAMEDDLNDVDFREFIKWNIERSLEITRREKAAEKHLDVLRTAQDAQNLRNFAVKYFGVQWCETHLKF